MATLGNAPGSEDQLFDLADDVTTKLEALRELFAGTHDGTRMDSPMRQLRKMRDLRGRIEDLTIGRDALIRDALAEGHSQNQVAVAAGLSQARIWEIKSKATGTEEG